MENLAVQFSEAASIAQTTLPQAKVDSKESPKAQKSEAVVKQEVAQTKSEPVVENAPTRTTTPSLTFQRDESGKTYIQVIDKKTGEVLRTVPPEELRNLAKRLAQESGRLTGNILDQVV